MDSLTLRILARPGRPFNADLAGKLARFFAYAVGIADSPSPGPPAVAGMLGRPLPQWGEASSPAGLAPASPLGGEAGASATACPP